MLLGLLRRSDVDEVLVTFNLGKDVCEEAVQMDPHAILLDSADARWGGPGTLLPGKIELETSALRYQPRSFAVFHRRVGSDG